VTPATSKTFASVYRTPPFADLAWMAKPLRRRSLRMSPQHGDKKAATPPLLFIGLDGCFKVGRVEPAQIDFRKEPDQASALQIGQGTFSRGRLW
jgi:hypothetical protein